MVSGEPGASSLSTDGQESNYFGTPVILGKPAEGGIKAKNEKPFFKELSFPIENPHLLSKINPFAKSVTNISLSRYFHSPRRDRSD